jgi:hypothetical protein
MPKLQESWWSWHLTCCLLAKHAIYPWARFEPPWLTLARQFQMGVKRECFGCGHNVSGMDAPRPMGNAKADVGPNQCAECIRQYIKACRVCKHDYCVLENESRSEALVGCRRTWPGSTSGN